MKKLLPVALLAALSFSFVACGDGDVACFQPKYLSLLDSMAKINGADKELSSITSVEEAVEPCNTFYADIKTVIDGNKDITGESIKTEFNDFKNTSWVCQAAVGLSGAVKTLGFSTVYNNIKSNVTYCSELVGAAGVVGLNYTKEEMTNTFTTMEGWSGVLQTAADYTAKKAEENDNKKAE